MISNDPSRNINLNEYATFCSKLNIDYRIKHKSLFDRYIDINKIEDDVFLADETVFDIDDLRKQLIDELKKSSVNVVMNQKVNRIEALPNNEKKTFTNSYIYKSDFIINCTYGEINNIIADINCKIDLKFQNVLLPIISTNQYIPGMTIMDGPFCSILPKGLTSSQYILSDVKKSVLNEASSLSELPNLSKINKFTATQEIIESMKNYIKLPEDFKVVDYWLTRKSLSIQKNDERLTHVFSHNNTGVFSVLQGKISTSQIVFKELLNLMK